MSLNNKAWKKLFETYNIPAQINKYGFFEIEAKTIKTVREPRLMAKFDHKNNLPEIFRENHLSILPITRSRYVLGNFDAYQSIEYDEKIAPVHMSLPDRIETIDPFNLYSESSALHCAYVSGMISEVLGESCLQTVSGRMSSQTFQFKIRTYNSNERSINIQNAQVEIDGGYESENYFAIVEAKKETVNDFLVRQLYYPYRLWKNKIQKEIKPIFFTHSNDIFSFFVYEFEDPESYNSLRLVMQKNYMIAHEKIVLKDIIDILQGITIVPEPKLPFPQADSFTRIVDLLGLLVEDDLEKDFITSNYNFDERQTNYYTTAAMYLGLVEKYTQESGNLSKIKFKLTDRGDKIMKMPYKQKYLALAKSILEHNVFNQVLKEYLKNFSNPSKPVIVEIMKQSNLYKVESESTYRRRASTVVSWIGWVLSLKGD